MKTRPPDLLAIDTKSQDSSLARNLQIEGLSSRDEIPGIANLPALPELRPIDKHPAMGTLKPKLIPSQNDRCGGSVQSVQTQARANPEVTGAQTARRVKMVSAGRYQRIAFLGPLSLHNASIPQAAPVNNPKFVSIGSHSKEDAKQNQN